MEDARFLVHIKTPFLSSAMPYMVSPRDIQKKKNSISTGNEDKEGNMPKSQELDPDIRLRQMRNFEYSYFKPNNSCSISLPLTSSVSPVL